jgi:hypothetical protein
VRSKSSLVVAGAIFTLVAHAPPGVAGLWAQGVEPSSPATAEATVRDLYARVTVEPGTLPDWDAVRELFLPEAVIVLRTSRDATTVFSLEGFVEDFVSFIERAGVERTGFTERVVRLRMREFGDMASALVLYEAQIPGSGRPPQPGVDAFLLSRRDGVWKIASVVNEVPMPGRPLPPDLLD